MSLPGCRAVNAAAAGWQVPSCRRCVAPPISGSLPSTSCENHSLRSNRRRDHLWHLAKANEPNDNFYREVAARFGGRWLVRSNLRGPGDPEPSSRAVLNISELSVPGWDHAPYKVCAGAQEMHGMPESCCGGQQIVSAWLGPRTPLQAVCGTGRCVRQPDPVSALHEALQRILVVGWFHIATPGFPSPCSQAGSEHAKMAVCVGMREGGEEDAAAAAFACFVGSLHAAAAANQRQQ